MKARVNERGVSVRRGSVCCEQRIIIIKGKLIFLVNVRMHRLLPLTLDHSWKYGGLAVSEVGNDNRRMMNTDTTGPRRT